MAVCKTIRTKESIVEFLIQSENGDECVSAFKYVDGKIEVHSLKAECAPLYLDEKTCVNLLSAEKFPSVLLAATLKTNQVVEFRAWDVSGTQGFMSKDFQLPSAASSESSKKESNGKTKYTFSLKSYLTKDSAATSDITCSSYKDLLCVVVNGAVCLLFKLKLLESVNFFLEHRDTFKFPEPSTTILHSVFLKAGQDKNYIAALEKQSISLLTFENGNLELSHTVQSKGPPMTKLHRLTLSKCLIIDSQGQLSLFSPPNEVVPLKLPSSIKGHSICSAIGFKYTNEGMLAICNNDYTINFYSLADILCSVSNNKAIFVKPYRVFCSQFPINAINFLKSDQLSMVSTVNQSITLLGGLSKGFS